MAEAAEAYDELLYEIYDEVTPFQVPHDNDLSQYADPDDPEAISVLVRRDYLIADPRRLRAAELLMTAPPSPTPVGRRPTGSAPSGWSSGSRPDEIAARAEEFGLEEGDSTLWVTAADPVEPGTGSPSPSRAPTRPADLPLRRQ